MSSVFMTLAVGIMSKSLKSFLHELYGIQEARMEFGA